MAVKLAKPAMIVLHNLQMIGIAKPAMIGIAKAAITGLAGFAGDLDPKTFTLGSLFAMNLHQQAAEVGSICLSAVKELTIESELKKIADVWRDARFDVHNYNRGGPSDRGLILKGLVAPLVQKVYASAPGFRLFQHGIGTHP